MDNYNGCDLYILWILDDGESRDLFCCGDWHTSDFYDDGLYYVDGCVDVVGFDGVFLCGRDGYLTLNF